MAKFKDCVRSNLSAGQSQGLPARLFWWLLEGMARTCQTPNLLAGAQMHKAMQSEHETSDAECRTSYASVDLSAVI
jgi:hypothetical protein